MQLSALARRLARIEPAVTKESLALYFEEERKQRGWVDVARKPRELQLEIAACVRGSAKHTLMLVLQDAERNHVNKAQAEGMKR